MQKITPFLWFNDQAEEAMNFYVSVFMNSSVGKVSRQGDKVFSVTFVLDGQEFYALNGGPMFTITPAVSFFVECGSEAEIDALWGKLLPGGKAAMALGTYPFSKKFGWVMDRFGVSWQLNLAGGSARKQTIKPFLMFVGEQQGKAEEAVRFYTSIVENSQIESVTKFGKEEMGGAEGTVKGALFRLAGQTFMAMDGAGPHAFTFTPAVSLFVNCAGQEEVDRLWDAFLANGGKASRCGWLTDKWGLSWQIIPEALGWLMGGKDREKAGRVVQAMMKMGKIDVKGLEAAYAG